MKDTLTELGFTPYEADIYLCLLENGQLSAYETAEKTGLYRQACYDALNRMMEKGVATSLREGRKTLFKAAAPHVLEEQLRRKAERLKAIIPDLLASQETSEDSVSVEVFKGKNVLRLGLQDIPRTLQEHGGSDATWTVARH